MVTRCNWRCGETSVTKLCFFQGSEVSSGQSVGRGSAFIGSGSLEMNGWLLMVSVSLEWTWESLSNYLCYCGHRVTVYWSVIYFVSSLNKTCLEKSRKISLEKDLCRLSQHLLQISADLLERQTADRRRESKRRRSNDSRWSAWCAEVECPHGFMSF